MIDTPTPNRPSATKSGFTHESAHAATVEWYTPRWVFDALRLHFSIDVCSPGAHLTEVPATAHYTFHDDGLTSPWRGTVWCNPPYGRETRRWMRKLADHHDGIALVFARTDTAWFQKAAATADTICFIAGRVKFIDGRTGEIAKGSPGSGSALIAYGAIAGRALRQSGLGLCVRPTQASEGDDDAQ